MSERILIIDDDEIVRTGLAADLAEVGFEPHTAASGYEGLKYLGEKDVSLVLLDLVIGEMTGIEVLQEIRRKHTRLPVIILTGHGSMSTALSALRLGANDYLFKPADADEVVHRIDTVLQLERLRNKIDYSEKEAQKFDSMRNFAGGMAHRLNNQLTIIKNCVQDIAHDLPEGDSKKRCVWVMSSIEIVESLSKKLLAYSGGGYFALREIDLSEVLPKAVDDFAKAEDRIVSGDIELKSVVSDALALMQGEEDSVRSMLTHLLQNACEAIGDSGGTITVSLGNRVLDEGFTKMLLPRQHLLPGRYYCVEISDTGCGMDDATQQKIFDPFFTTKFTGRGLGLPLALGVALGHGGGLYVSSTKGRGTTVSAFLPAAEKNKPEQQIEAVSHAETVRAETILIVEDEAAIRLLAEKTLSREGYETLTASDGVEAIETFLENMDSIDLIVLDMTLPKKNGDEVIQQIRSVRPEAKILITSGMEAEALATKTTSDRLADYISKPFELGVLRSKVRALLDA